MSSYLDLMSNLKLTGMRESVNYRLEEAIQGNLDFQEFLCLLLEDEKLYRKNRRSELLRRKAKFNDSVFLEDFDSSPERGVTKQMVKKLASLNFLERNENVIFVGGTGGGKSYLAQALGQKTCLNGFESFYFPVNKFFKEVEEAEVAGIYLKFLSRLKKAKLLVFDDFGLRNYSHHEASVFYDVLEDRYQKGSVVITSQVKPLGWKKLFEDEVIAEAIVDRLTSCSHVIEVKGSSFRKNHGPKEKIESKI
jgi:DNA replication protein DnaC